MRGLTGKVAIIAGAGAAVGIGAASALRLAEEGASVVVGNINLDGAKAIAGKITAAGARATPVRFDICDDESVRQLVETAVITYGGVDAIHINAADTSIRRQDTDAVSVPLEVFQRTLDVGLRGHLLCTRHAVPELLKRGGGAIIYTSSDSAMFGQAHYVSYMVAKSGVNALMRHTAARWGKEGIRANAISPGLVLTDTVMRDHTAESKGAILAASKSKRLGEPEDIAALVAMLASDDGAWINGQVISINGGFLMR
jgi:NAD(P)-dependent dehydrogenase (short-subunit alcohol dehydrogenase family)